MSTLAEIQAAIGRLRDDEKKALASWLDSQFAIELSPEDEQRLVRSLDEAIRDVDAGRGVPMDEVRKMVDSWTAR
jgi:predicted transcriptional regulator